MKSKRKTDQISYYDRLLGWYHLHCNLCQDKFLVKEGFNRKGYCSCDKLVKSQGRKQSLIYILENEDGLIKVGLSIVGKGLTDRIRKLNNEIKNTQYKPFKFLFKVVIDNRSEAYSLERLIHTELKSYKIFENSPYTFQGQGEIYSKRLLPFVFDLLLYHIK